MTDAREVATQKLKLVAVARQIMWSGFAQTAEEILARYGAERYAAGLRDALEIVEGHDRVVAGRLLREAIRDTAP